MDRVVLLRTPHGSHLYGTARPESDLDFFTVVEKRPYGSHNVKQRYAEQKITGKYDETVVDLSTFMLGCAKGVPQYLEAMFSDQATTDVLADFRLQYRVGSSVLPTYARTIKSFSYDERDGGVKKRRHALRLGLNARELLTTGRFCPTLSPDVAARLFELAEQDPDTVYQLALDTAWGYDTI